MMDATVEASSPFLPRTNIQYAWDSTSIGWFKTCPRLYQYSMIEGWTPKAEGVHLRFGIELHQALQDYEISRAVGIKHEDAVRDVLRALLIRTDDWESDHKLKNKPYLVRTVLWYLDKFEDDPAVTHVMEGGKAAVEVSFRIEMEWGPSADQPYLLCGHLDRVVNFGGHLYVMDHKTTTSTPGEYYFNQFEPNNQMTLYTLAGQIIFKSPIRGVIIDCIQIAQGFSRFTRGFTYRTPDQIQEWLDDLRHHLRLAEQYATKGYWPQNDTACDKFGGCRFREICSKSPSVRKNFLASNFTQEDRWNPMTIRG